MLSQKASRARSLRFDAGTRRVGEGWAGNALGHEGDVSADTHRVPAVHRVHHAPLRAVAAAATESEGGERKHPLEARRRRTEPWRR